MEAVTIRAEEIRVGDRFAVPETGRPGVLVTDANLPPWDAVEVWTESDPMGMPVNLRRDDRVEVWREVCPDCDGRGGQVCPDEWRTDSDGRRRHLAGGWVVCGTCGGDGVPA